MRRVRTYDEDSVRGWVPRNAHGHAKNRACHCDERLRASIAALPFTPPTRRALMAAVPDATVPGTSAEMRLRAARWGLNNGSEQRRSTVAQQHARQYRN